MQRRAFVDWVRGVVVVAMVAWHTADGWLQPDLRVGQSWALLRFVGGLPAPSFLFLAGAALALSARPERTQLTSTLVSVSRGLEIILFGYALRLQTWLIDASAISHLHLARSWLPLGLGYLALFLALRTLARDRLRARNLALLGALLSVVGLAQVPWLAPGRLLRLLQIDVLQAIGASLVLLTLGERRWALLQRPALAIAIGAGVACVSEFVWSLLPGVLPVPLAAYLGKFAPAAGMPQPALFPLFPWFAYASIGAAFGSKLRQSLERGDAFVVYAGLAGAALSLATSEAHRFVQDTIALAPWTVQPLRVAFRVGLTLVMLLGGWVWAHAGRGRMLVSFGRASLRVYWAHLLIAYGSLGHPWQRQLSLEQWAIRVVPLLAVMWLLTRIGSARVVPQGAEAST